MGLDTGHYFGAYLEIKVKKMEKIETYRECDRGHLRKFEKFCSKCGGLLKQKRKTVYEYPTLIVDHLLENEKWENVLNVITPPNLCGKGTIIAIDNNSSNSLWLYASGYGYDEDIQTKPFPTSSEINVMKEDLITNCNDIIKALKQSKYVISIEVKAGYVLDQEY